MDGDILIGVTFGSALSLETSDMDNNKIGNANNEKWLNKLIHCIL